MNSLDLTARKVLMSAYLYYHRDTSVLSDAENDSLCADLYLNWDDVPQRYMPLLDPDNTNGESIMATTHHCKFTKLVEGGALAWLNKIKGEKLEPLKEGHYQLTEEERLGLGGLV